jgi:O-antigen ligase
MKGLLFTYALTYGGAVTSLANPFYGLLIYVCFAIIRPVALWHWSVPPGNYSRIIAFALLAGWLLHGLGNWNMARARPVLLALLLWWAWLVIHASISPDPTKAWYAVEQLSKCYLPFVCGLTLIDSADKLKQLAWVLVLSQGYLAYEFNLDYYTMPLFLPEEFNFGGLDNNGIAITMATSTGLAFFLGMYAPRKWQKLVAFSSAALMAHVILFSMSRGGMLALIVTGTIAFLLIPKKPKHYVVFLIAVLVTLRLAGPAVQREFLSAFEENAEHTRTAHWAACIDSMAKDPVIGVGLDQWGNVAPDYGLPRGMEAHSTWLQIGAELGVTGLLMILAFYGFAVVRLWPIARGRGAGQDAWRRAFASMAIASLAGFFASAAFVTVEGVELPFYVVLLGAGVLKALPYKQSARAPGFSWQTSRSLRGVTAHHI